MSIQAVLFDKHIWSPQEARNWLHSHDLHPIKHVHTTANYLRYRIEQPRVTKKYSSKVIGDGIILVLHR